MYNSLCCFVNYYTLTITSNITADQHYSINQSFVLLLCIVFTTRLGLGQNKYNFTQVCQLFWDRPNI